MLDLSIAAERPGSVWKKTSTSTETHKKCSNKIHNLLQYLSLSLTHYSLTERKKPRNGRMKRPTVNCLSPFRSLDY
jgi:hypothetical protein